MDFYSGSGGNNYVGNTPDFEKQNNFKDFFNENSSIILIIVAMIITLMISGFLLFGVGGGRVQSGKDTNKYLKTLSVDYGSLDPAFDKKTTEYTVRVPLDVVSVRFTCEAESIKAVIKGCDEDVVLDTDHSKTKHEIRVEAEDTGVKRYNITIIRE